MHQRAVYQKAAPDVVQSMIVLSTAVQKSGLPPELLDLVDYRVSQINAAPHQVGIMRTTGAASGPAANPT